MAITWSFLVRFGQIWAVSISTLQDKLIGEEKTLLSEFIQMIYQILQKMGVAAKNRHAHRDF